MRKHLTFNSVMMMRIIVIIGNVEYFLVRLSERTTEEVNIKKPPQDN